MLHTCEINEVGDGRVYYERIRISVRIPREKSGETLSAAVSRASMGTSIMYYYSLCASNYY